MKIEYVRELDSAVVAKTSSIKKGIPVEGGDHVLLAETE